MMKFCIFSYNRGHFLENLVHSILRCVENSEILVVDDNSDDEDTCRILKGMENNHKVIRPDASADTERHGGLYNNKNLALPHIADDDMVCFLHDDIQIIRKISADDIADIENYFLLNPNTPFLRPSFLKGINEGAENFHWNEKKQACFFNHPVHYQDVSIIKVDRLIKNKWQFGNSEPANMEMAESIFDQTGVMKNPFLHYLPNAPAYRLKHKTLSVKLMEKCYGGGLYPFEIMSDADNRAFVSRPPDVLPVAEDFLSLRGQPAIGKPWKYNIVSLNKPLKILHNIEMKVHRYFNR